MSLTAAETEKWRKHFNEADLNSDGKLSVKELPEVMKRCGLGTPSKMLMHFVLDILDTDADRMISFDEFLLMDITNLKKWLTEKFQKDFKDVQYLDEADVKKVLMSMSSCVTTAEVDSTIKEADKNKDGKLEIMEFIDYFIAKMFSE